MPDAVVAAPLVARLDAIPLDRVVLLAELPDGQVRRPVAVAVFSQKRAPEAAPGLAERRRDRAPERVPLLRERFQLRRRRKLPGLLHHAHIQIQGDHGLREPRRAAGPIHGHLVGAVLLVDGASQNTLVAVAGLPGRRRERVEARFREEGAERRAARFMKVEVEDRRAWRATFVVLRR